MIDAIKEVSCTRCLHQEVCRYKPDFLDICNAVSSSIVNRPFEDGKKVETTPITNFDFLGGIQIKCRYYQTQSINPRLFDTTPNPLNTTITNPCVMNASPNPYVINGSSDCTIKKED